MTAKANTTYIVPDLLTHGLRLVFCGTAPSRVSKEKRAYYANPGNRFWKSLFEAKLTPHRFVPTDYPKLLDLGIGLTDLNKHEWGNDDELTGAGFDIPAFTAKMRRYRPGAVAFTSKYTASLYLGCKTGDLAYGLHAATVEGIPLHVLPSTSGQAVRYFNLAPWADLARLIDVGVASDGAAAPVRARRRSGGAGGLRP